MEAMNAYLREDAPKRKEHLSELYKVDWSEVGIREAD